MAQYRINKISNSYADLIPPSVYESIPKAVWAAIAISYATSGGDMLDDATSAIIQEWRILNENGIVPQSVPASLQRKYQVENK